MQRCGLAPIRVAEPPREALLAPSLLEPDDEGDVGRQSDRRRDDLEARATTKIRDVPDPLVAGVTVLDQ